MRALCSLLALIFTALLTTSVIAWCVAWVFVWPVIGLLWTFGGL